MRKTLAWACRALLAVTLAVAFGCLPEGGSGSATGGTRGGHGAGRHAEPSWEYSSQTDPMGRGTTRFATLKSVNEADFDFPYNGGSRGVLMLRNSPKYGRDAIFQITKGQFICRIDGCSVNLRVDKGRPVGVRAQEAADGSSNVLFLPYGALLRNIRKAKVLRIEANFYQEGSRVFEFHPQGLDVKKLARTK